MNAQKFTKKALEALGSAQSIAIENQNMQVMPEHLLYALVDQDGGLIPGLLKKDGDGHGQTARDARFRDRKDARGERKRQRTRQDLHLSRDGQDTFRC